MVNSSRVANMAAVTDTSQILRAIEQQGAQTQSAIQAIGMQLRDSSGRLSDTIDRFAESIEKQITLTATAIPARGSSNDQGVLMWAIGLVITIIVAAATIAFIWIGGVSDRAKSDSDSAKAVAEKGIDLLQGELHSSARDGLARDETSIEDRRNLKATQVAMKQKLDEIETQFRAMWMMFDAELQQQDRIDSFLWNYQHKDMPWEPRRYFPSMGSPPTMSSNDG